MANRLAHALSPYLRQHAENPVDWYEWGPEAFAAAKERDVPIFLSVGYAACHWCHVMAHESFDDAQLAGMLNANFVAIKVDREERPDIDAVYMDVTQALTGQGGWPMSVFLTPDAKPLFAGTYFPPDHFRQVLTAIDDIWRTDRAKAEDTATNIVNALRQHAASGRPAQAVNSPEGHSDSSVLLSDDVLARSVRQLRQFYDDARGGFGGAPKFPPSMTLEHLLRHHARTGDSDALAMAERTCEAMARGGMYDQLDGGFARYSVDANWVVPHFEKMLYDNAQLLRVYTHLFRQTGSPLARRVALETAEFMLRRLLTGEGALASALDADTDGVEGLTYAWTPEQLRAALGDADGTRAATLLEVTQTGTFEHGTSTLQLCRDPRDVFTAAELGQDPESWWATIKTDLQRVREERPQPARDDKVVTSWNGLAVSALVEAAMILNRPDLLESARAIADYLLAQHVIDGRLRRTSLGGVVSAAAGMADDYGNLAEGLMMLHQATAEAQYLSAATELLDTAKMLFIADDGVFDAPADREALFTRPQSSGDNAEPCGASSLASAYVMAFALTNQPGYRDLALRCLGQVERVAESNPRFAGWALATAEALAAGPLQVAIVPGSDADAAEFVDAAWQSTSPGLVRVSGAPDTAGVPLLVERPGGDGVRAYVCRGFVCDAPVGEVAALREALG